MPQRVGDYRDRIVIQKRSETRDGAGEPIASYSQFAVRWASRKVLGESERGGPAIVQAAQGVEFRTHLTRGVDAKMRVLAPGAVTKLTTGVTSATTTSLVVADADGFPLEGGYRARVASELVEVTAGQGTTTWTVTRGVDGTSAATAYATGQGVQLMQAHDVEGAHVDWRMGAETVIRARLTDGAAA